MQKAIYYLVTLSAFIRPALIIGRLQIGRPLFGQRRNLAKISPKTKIKDKKVEFMRHVHMNKTESRMN